MSETTDLLVAAQRVIDASREVVRLFRAAVEDEQLLSAQGPIQLLRDRLDEYDATRNGRERS